jgi:hypothetical protein
LLGFTGFGLSPNYTIHAELAHILHRYRQRFLSSVLTAVPLLSKPQCGLKGGPRGIPNLTVWLN